MRKGRYLTSRLFCVRENSAKLARLVARARPVMAAVIVVLAIADIPCGGCSRLLLCRVRDGHRNVVVDSRNAAVKPKNENSRLYRQRESGRIQNVLNHIGLIVHRLGPRTVDPKRGVRFSLSPPFEAACWRFSFFMVKCTHERIS